MAYVQNNIKRGDEIDRGMFNPLWVRVKDDDLEFDPLATVKVWGADYALIKHRNDDAWYHADRPFIQVARPLKPGVTATNIKNSHVEHLPQQSIYARTDGPALRTMMGFSDTRSYNPYLGSYEQKVFTYAAGTIVKIDWFNNLIDEGWQVTGAKVLESENYFWRALFPDDFDLLYQNDNSASVLNWSEGITDSGKRAIRFVVGVDKWTADENKTKLIQVSLQRDNDGELETKKSNVPFRVSPLQTVVLAIDGLAYQTATKLVDAENGSRYFKQVFEHALGTDQAALSAMPTITWTNWPGVFSGGPPSKHGWLGNSYFPRENTDTWKKYPVFSSGKESKIDLGPHDFGLINLDKQQQAGVALGGNLALGPHAQYSMAERSLAGAGSLYSDLATTLANTDLKVASIHNFYSKNGDNVDMDDAYFGVTNAMDLGHSREAAEGLDNRTFGSFAIGGGPLAAKVWADAKDELDILSVYLPGTDNAGHTFGLADLGVDSEQEDNGDSLALTQGSILDGDFWTGVDATDAPDVLHEHASSVTDAALGRVVEKIWEEGYQNAVMFAMVADHGLHAFRSKNEEYVLLTKEVGRLFESTHTDAAAAGVLGWEFWNGDNFDTMEAVYSPNGAMGHFYLKGDAGTWQSPPTNERILKVAALLYREAVGNRNPETGKHPYLGDGNQIVCEFAPRIIGKRCEHYDERKNRDGEVYHQDDIPSHGLLGKIPAIFVKAGNGNNFEADYRWVRSVTKNGSDYTVHLDSLDAFEAARHAGMPIKTAQTASERASAYYDIADDLEIDPLLTQEIKEQAASLKSEIEGSRDTALQKAAGEAALDTINNSSNVSILDQYIADAWDAARQAKDKTHQLAALLGKTVECTEDVCNDVDAEPDATHWPAFEERIEELNHKNASGSRSGDVLVILDGVYGYLTVNNQHEVFPGWHGGPTESESFVPLLFAMPGPDYVDSGGGSIAYPSAFAQGYNSGIDEAGVSSDGYLRNWHLSPLLNRIMAQFREN